MFAERNASPASSLGSSTGPFRDNYRFDSVYFELKRHSIGNRWSERKGQRIVRTARFASLSLERSVRCTNGRSCLICRSEGFRKYG